MHTLMTHYTPNSQKNEALEDHLPISPSVPYAIWGLQGTPTFDCQSLFPMKLVNLYHIPYV